MFSHGSGALKRSAEKLPSMTLVMYSPVKGIGKFKKVPVVTWKLVWPVRQQAHVKGQGTGSGSNTLDPWRLSPKTTVCSANFESSWWAKDSVNPYEGF